jgi:hypothetical protein
MGIWDGFRDGIKKNLGEGKEILEDGVVKIGNGIADAINLPEDPKQPDPDDTFDYILYASGGIAVLALLLVVMFKF